MIKSKTIKAAFLCLAALAAGSIAYAGCPTFQEFEYREMRLEMRIDHALEAGLLTSSQAEKFKKKLEKVAHRLAGHKARCCLTSLDSQGFNEELSAIGSQLTRSLRQQPNFMASAPR